MFPIAVIGMPALSSVRGVPIIGRPRTVLVQGVPVACIGDPITPHGKGPHLAPFVATGAPTVLAEGIPVTTATSLATCGDPIIATTTVVVGLG